MPKPPKKKNRAWIFILIPIVIIATCNVYLNTHQENAILEDPGPGDYFVFHGLLGSGDQPLKLRSVRNDTMEFLLPRYEFMDFQLNHSESRVREMDQQGKLFDSAYTVKFTRTEVNEMRKNASLGARLEGGSKVYIKNVFGRWRRNAVDDAMGKLAGTDSSGK